MDLLYSRYASPKELMNTYIKRGRFEEFVTNIIRLENNRRKEQAEKDEEQKLWSMYIHSMSDKSFNDWKAGVLPQNNAVRSSGSSGDENMTDEDIINIVNDLFQ